MVYIFFYFSVAIFADRTWLVFINTQSHPLWLSEQFLVAGSLPSAHSILTFMWRKRACFFFYYYYYYYYCSQTKQKTVACFYMKSRIQLQSSECAKMNLTSSDSDRWRHRPRETQIPLVTLIRNSNTDFFLFGGGKDTFSCMPIFLVIIFIPSVTVNHAFNLNILMHHILMCFM